VGQLVMAFGFGRGSSGSLQAVSPPNLRLRLCATRSPRSSLSRQPLGRRDVALLAICVLGLGCSERLTPSRAGTIIRHSKAFLSGSPESHPVFDKVTALFTGSEGWTPERQEGNSYIADFSYHWPEDPKAEGVGRPVPELTARVVLRRLGNSWAVDDDQSRALVDSWPQLPKTPNPFSSPRERFP
jgi:hypothetical protein